MQYVAVENPGGPDVLKLAERPVPEPKPQEVLIAVEAAGVNRPDVLQRAGHYPPPPGADPNLGLEVAGTIAALGAEVTGPYQIGDRVCALVNGGGYAQYCVAPVGQCLPWPKDYTALEAAALPETYFTVWANLFQRGHLQRGESTLIHGGTSGIGVTAIQLAHEFGATVYATAGSKEKCDACRKFGATEAINYREEDFAARIAELTEKRGVDVILDMVGAPYTNRNLESLALDGRLVQIAVMQGESVNGLSLVRIMSRRLTLTGSTLRPRTAEQKAAIAQSLREHVWPILDAGRCGPVIHQTFPLAEAAAAHRLMETSTHIGKIMLRVV